MKKNLTHCRIRALKYFSGFFHWRQQTPTQAKDHRSPAVECSLACLISLFTYFAHFRLCASASHHRCLNLTQIVQRHSERHPCKVGVLTRLQDKERLIQQVR